jgi:hypothetical protein
MYHKITITHEKYLRGVIAIYVPSKRDILHRGITFEY